MAVRRLHPEQPETFAFTPENEQWVEATIAKYPPGRQASAVIPLLWRVQEQEGWVSRPAIEVVARRLDMPFIRVLEVATFYTMFHLAPVGRKAHIQVCGTTPCMLRGAEDLIAVCRRRIAPHPLELSQDGDFSWEEVECLGACVNAPMVQIFADTYEDLTPEAFEALIDGFRDGRPPKPGPQIDRQYSAPVGGPTTLKEGIATARERPPGDVRPDHPQQDDPRTPAASNEHAGAPDPSTGSEAEATRTVPSRGKTGPSAEDAGEVKPPPGIEAPRGGKADDLKLISGIGPKIERTLNELGIFHFWQIAEWTAENKAWVDGFLRFHGRIDREDWVGQAKALAAGGAAEAAGRHDG